MSEDRFYVHMGKNVLGLKVPEGLNESKEVGEFAEESVVTNLADVCRKGNKKRER